MEMRVLRYFLAVAREENITRAAEYLNITQPTLSRQLALLEEETGVTLFTRGSKRITLTDEGLLLRRRAQEIVALADKTMEELSSKDKNLSGTVTIGTGGLSANAKVLQAAESFRKLHPDVKFSIFIGTADSVQDRIDSGLADFGILLEPVSVEKYGFIRLPQKERWAVIIHGNHRLAAKDKICVEDLKDELLVFPERLSVQSELHGWFSSLEDELRVAYSSNLSLIASEIVMCSDAVAFVIEGSLPYVDLAKIAIRPLFPTLESGTVIAYKKRMPLSPVAAEFFRYLKCFLGME